MELLGSAYAMLLELVLDRRAREFFDLSSRHLAKQIYQGYWYDLSSQMALEAVQKTAELVTGTIEIELYKGQLKFVSVTEVPHSLYSESAASMEKIGEYDHSDSEGLLRVFGVSARVLARAGQIVG